MSFINTADNKKEYRISGYNSRFYSYVQPEEKVYETRGVRDEYKLMKEAVSIKDIFSNL